MIVVTVAEIKVKPLPKKKRKRVEKSTVPFQKETFVYEGQPVYFITLSAELSAEEVYQLLKPFKGKVLSSFEVAAKYGFSDLLFDTSDFVKDKCLHEFCRFARNHIMKSRVLSIKDSCGVAAPHLIKMIPYFKNITVQSKSPAYTRSLFAKIEESFGVRPHLSSILTDEGVFVDVDSVSHRKALSVSIDGKEHLFRPSYGTLPDNELIKQLLKCGISKEMILASFFDEND